MHLHKQAIEQPDGIVCLGELYYQRSVDDRELYHDSLWSTYPRYEPGGIIYWRRRRNPCPHRSDSEAHTTIATLWGKVWDGRCNHHRIDGMIHS